jgi:hypothetical protein
MSAICGSLGGDIRLSEWLVSVCGRAETVRLDTCSRSGIDVFYSIFCELSNGVFVFSGRGVNVRV